MRYKSGKVTKVSGDNDSIKIEGIANHAEEIDRHNEVIPANEWELGNYKSNPIILYNHDPLFPLGVSEEVKPVEKGLFVRGDINSPSTDDETIRVKSAITGGILKALSVGIGEPRSKEKGDNGQDILKGVELWEITVTPVGVSQGALFNVVKSAVQINQFADQLKTLAEASTEIQREIVSIKKSLEFNTRDLDPSKNQNATDQADLEALEEMQNITRQIEELRG